jgi:Family of unknown function (DUF5681)
MTANNLPKKKPTGSYPVGYARPPKATQFQPNQSGNLHGRPKGRPSLNELLLEEYARMVKVKVGDQVVHIDKERAMVRMMIDTGLKGDIHAARFSLALLDRAKAELEVAPDPQTPLTGEELEVLKMMASKSGK